MQFNALRPVLALLVLNFLTACAAPGRVVFDASAVPVPPSYTAEFKRALAAEVTSAPRSEMIITALTDASQFYDQIRRLKGGPQ